MRNYFDVLGNARTWTLFRNSVSLATLTTIVTGFAGVTLAVLLAKTNLPLRTPLLIVFSMPLLFSPYLLAVGWIEILGRRGLLAQWVDVAAGEVSSTWLFGLSKPVHGGYGGNDGDRDC